MKKKDLLLVISALFIAAVCFFLQKYPKYADEVKISVNGKIYCEKKLSENCEIDINGTNTAVIENGCVYMKHADCPDKLCVSSGKICDSSKKIICLPNKVVIEVTKSSDADTVVRR